MVWGHLTNMSIVLSRLPIRSVGNSFSVLRDFFEDCVESYFLTFSPIHRDRSTSKSEALSLHAPRSSPILLQLLGKNISSLRMGSFILPQRSSSSFRLTMGSIKILRTNWTQHAWIISNKRIFKAWERLSNISRHIWSVTNFIRSVRNRTDESNSSIDNFFPIEKPSVVPFFSLQGIYVRQSFISISNTIFTCLKLIDVRRF